MASVTGRVVSYLLLLLLLCVSRHSSLESSSLRPSKKSEKLFPSNCGRQPFLEELGGRHKRLVNGDYSAFGEYPWLVAIDVLRETICSANIINTRWVVTAASCVNKHKAYSLNLRLGEWNKVSLNEPLRDVNLTVDKKIVHPRFNEKKFLTEGYDIALLKMVTPIIFRPHIQPICMPDKTEDQNITGKMAKLAGWGKIFPNDKDSSILQEVEIPIVDSEMCKQLFSNVHDRFGTLHDAFCAGYEHGKIALCYGDSGGGLQMQRKDGRWTLIGLTSWIPSRCADRYGMAVFTRVSSYIPWIRRILMLDTIT